MKLMHSALRTASCVLFAAGVTALAAAPVSAQTLTFDSLPSEQGSATDVALTVANSGSRTISGVTFNASDSNATAVNDWEIIGNQYIPNGSADIFAQSHSGDYALVGNTYTGVDYFGSTYDGLTFSTTQTLQSLYVGYDNNGGGVNDADTLTITAFGAAGTLATDTTTLTGPALSLLDTSSVFSGLSGVTGYRFETTASNALYAANGQAYVIADDLMFSAPVPEASTTLSFGLLLAFGGCGLAYTRRKKAQV